MRSWLTLALVPLWSYLAVSAFLYEKRCIWFLLTTLVIVASKSTFVVLLLAPLVLCFKYPRFRYGLTTLLVLGASLAAQVKSNALFDSPNSFNRLYAGLAYSLADVSQWPSQNDVERFVLVPAFVRPEQFAETGLPAFALAKWGHSYYFDLPTESPETMASYVKLGRKAPFLKLLVGHPHLALKLVEQSFKTAVAAEYTQRSHQQPNATEAMAEYRAMLRTAQRNLGLLFVVAIPLLMLSVAGSNPFVTVLLLAAIVSPIIVVLGDGYNELERHLLPFLVLILFSIPLVLSSPAASRTDNGSDFLRRAIGLSGQRRSS